MELIISDIKEFENNYQIVIARENIRSYPLI